MEKENSENKFKIEYVYLLFFVVLIITSCYLTVTSRVAWKICNGERISGLIVGSDEVDYAKHADTIIALFYDPATRFLKLLSIPRDTWVNFSDLNVTRINEVFTAVYRREKNEHRACRELKSRIENFFLPGEELTFYLQVDYTGFVKVIDLLGGVRTKIDTPMHYDDNWGKLHIHFSTGEYLLNGRRALEYVRYRDKQGDTGRILRQQTFIKSILIQKLRNPIVVYKIPAIIKSFFSNFHTNLNFWDLMALAMEFKDLPVKNVQSLQLPGRPYQGYWCADVDKIPILKSILTLRPINRDDATLKVTAEVWNATEEKGLALAMTRALRQWDPYVDILKWGNFGTVRQTTLIIDRIGDLRRAQKISRFFDNPEIVSIIDPTRMVHTTVVVGEDAVNKIKKKYPEFFRQLGQVP